VDTEITCRLTMRDIFKDWKDEITNSFSYESQQRAFEFCMGVS
jgi:hypothetical protein